MTSIGGHRKAPRADRNAAIINVLMMSCLFDESTKLPQRARLCDHVIAVEGYLNSFVCNYTGIVL